AALLAAAAVLPLAYEIFRAGYYGALVPLPALAKSASAARWRRGALYLLDVVWPYALWLPIAILVGLASAARRRRPAAGPDVVLAAAPLASAGLMALYVVRVGGDFMHARLLLPALFIGLCPVMVVPAGRLRRRGRAPWLAAIAAWAVVVAVVRGAHGHQTLAGKVGDERAGYVQLTGQAHPVDDDAFVRADAPVSTIVRDAAR